LMVAQNLIIFMIIIDLWTRHHFFSHNQSVTSSHSNVYQYIIFRKLLDCIFNSILLTFIWRQYSYQLTQLCLGCQGIMGYICYISEILNIIYTVKPVKLTTYLCWPYIGRTGEVLYSLHIRHLCNFSTFICWIPVYVSHAKWNRGTVYTCLYWSW
jgi:hypothetical protein